MVHELGRPRRTNRDGAPASVRTRRNNFPPRRCRCSGSVRACFRRRHAGQRSSGPESPAELERQTVGRMGKEATRAAPAGPGKPPRADRTQLQPAAAGVMHTATTGRDSDFGWPPAAPASVSRDELVLVRALSRSVTQAGSTSLIWVCSWKLTFHTTQLGRVSKHEYNILTCNTTWLLLLQIVPY
jgi:hypothetical protein